MAYKDPEKQRKRSHENYVKHRKERLKHQQEYQLNHREERKEYYNNNKDKYRALWQNWTSKHREERKEYHRKYDLEHAERKKEYRRTGIRGQRYRIRAQHNRFKPYKWLKTGLKSQGFNPQIHHEWIPKTAEYTGMALVEAKDHMRNIIKPLIILEGEIVWTNETDERSKLDLHH